MALKTWLKDILKSRDMTVSELARRVGVERAQMSKWVNGHIAPELERAIQIAEILRLPVEVIWERVE